MKTYHVVIGNGEANKFSRDIPASSARIALGRAFRAYEQHRQEQGARSLRKSLTGEGVRIFIREA